MNHETVYVSRRTGAKYSESPPFHPHTSYPEYSFHEVAECTNDAYDLVRTSFILAGLDEGSAGSADWNPLSEVIRPGQTVLLKPNLVKEFHPRDPEGWRYVLTHGSVIRAVADYVWMALDGRGTVVLADAPQTDSSWGAIIRRLGLGSVESLYRSHGLDFRVIDLRNEQWENRDGVIVARHRLPGDPMGGVRFDLGSASELADHHGGGRYYGADYDTRSMNSHHTGGRHEYLIAKTVIAADVLISLPKLKTHKKAGITVSMKNLVGVNADKNWLPHHTAGSPDNGGDEHPKPSSSHRIERAIASQFHRLATRIPVASAPLHRRARRVGLDLFGGSDKIIRSGNWWGNDTIWRMCLDLNKIVAYGDPTGAMRAPLAHRRKPHLVVVDGVLAGEGAGPTEPSRVDAGIVAFGSNAPSVDAACAVLMGFDPLRIPIVSRAFQCEAWPLTEWSIAEVKLRSNEDRWNGCLAAINPDDTFRFAPHFAWVGHIERYPQRYRESTDE